LSGIAARYRVTPASIISYNGITNPEQIFAGRSIFIPGASIPAWGSAASSASGPYDAWLARSLVESWARTYGILASLPLAVAWQESGFNQAMVSATGAIGVMQIEPYTAARISAYLGRRLNLYNLYDNVQAGVFWLTHLLVFYGWDKRLAIAAYYQGSKSLAAYGFYADTVQYVDNVLALQSRFG
jgi:soluble lytic murein transglycosylase-like protein